MILKSNEVFPTRTNFSEILDNSFAEKRADRNKCLTPDFPLTMV